MCDSGYETSLFRRMKRAANRTAKTMNSSRMVMPIRVLVFAIASLTGSLGYSEAIVIYYNKKSHSGLPMEKLYSHKVKKEQEEGESTAVIENTVKTENTDISESKEKVVDEKQKTVETPERAKGIDSLEISWKKHP